MTYCTQADIEAWTSYGATDFKQAGAVMTAEQWAAYCTALIAAVTAAVNRFCRRTSFSETEYTELHDGRGCTGDLNEFLESDRVYIPREQPVIAVSSVRVDESDPSSPPRWVERIPQSSTAAGDYDLVRRGPIKYLRFRTHVPPGGFGNVEITYTAGYPTGDPVLDDIKAIALDIAAQHLGRKKKLQEAIAARRVATIDAAEMTPPTEPDLTLTKDIKRRLASYRRPAAVGRAYR
jgi:hypothetical protein